MQIVLYLTHNCNLKCKYCFNGQSINKEMSLDVSEKSMKFIYEYPSTDRFYDIAFFGGEPLLRFDLIKHLFNYVRSNYPIQMRNTRFSLVTNGTILNAEIEEFLLMNQFTVLLSIDGLKKIHDLNRITNLNQGSYDLIMANIDFWKVLNNNNRLLIQMTITPETVGYLFQSVMNFKDMGFHSVIFYFDFNSKWDSKSLDRYELEIKKLGKAYELSITENECFTLPVFDSLISLGILKNQKAECNAGDTLFSVDTNGDIYPCQRFVKDGDNKAWVIGNVMSGLNEKINIFRELKRLKYPKCETCKLERRCKQKCTAINYSIAGDLNTEILLKCLIEQINIMNSDQIAFSLISKGKEDFIHLARTRFFQKCKTD